MFSNQMQQFKKKLGNVPLKFPEKCSQSSNKNSPQKKIKINK
jgi:hypothetical protein